MSKKMLSVVVGALALAGLVASPALAAHTNHLTPPGNVPVGAAIKAVCSVTGTVNETTGGVSDIPSHNHYAFVGTNIDCPSALATQDQGGFYDVQASGGTDGPLQPDLSALGTLAHGETCAVGWSHGGSANFNVTRQGDGKTTGASARVDFVRVGGQVTAWGTLPWTSKKHDAFIAELIFTPAAPDIVACLPLDGSLITTATLQGVAVTYTPALTLPVAQSAK